MPVTVPAICEVAQLELYFTALDAAFWYEFSFVVFGLYPHTFHLEASQAETIWSVPNKGWHS